jgi:hypothetical protein
MQSAAMTIEAWFDAQIAAGYAAQPSTSTFPRAESLVTDDLPPAVHEAREHYRAATADWGSAWAFRQSIDGRDVHFVFCGTDGDAAWLEVFADGIPIAAASLDGHRASWGSRAQVRATVPSSE